MNEAILRHGLVLASMAMGLVGCSIGQRPFRTIQICLAGTHEIPEFTSSMDQVAQKYRMEFSDRSGQTEAELRSLASGNKDVPVSSPALNIAGTRGSDLSFGASNVGLPADQIAIGFNGSDLYAVKKFAATVVGMLSARWHVHEVAAGSGAFPLAECARKATNGT